LAAAVAVEPDGFRLLYEVGDVRVTVCVDADVGGAPVDALDVLDSDALVVGGEEFADPGVFGVVVAGIGVEDGVPPTG